MTNRPDRRTLRPPHRGTAATTALCTRPAGDLDRLGPVHGSSRHFGANASPGSGATVSTTLRPITATAGMLDTAARPPAAQIPTNRHDDHLSREAKPTKACRAGPGSRAAN